VKIRCNIKVLFSCVGMYDLWELNNLQKYNPQKKT